MIFGLCFRLRFRDLYFSVLEIFLFQLYCFINYYFRALSFLFLIHRWIKIYMNLESSLKKLKLKSFWFFFIRSFNPAPSAIACRLERERESCCSVPSVTRFSLSFYSTDALRARLFLLPWYYDCTLPVSRLASLKAAAEPVVQQAAHRARLSESPSACCNGR